MHDLAHANLTMLMTACILLMCPVQLFLDCVRARANKQSGAHLATTTHARRCRRVDTNGVSTREAGTVTAAYLELNGRPLMHDRANNDVLQLHLAMVVRSLAQRRILSFWSRASGSFEVHQQVRRWRGLPAHFGAFTSGTNHAHLHIGRDQTDSAKTARLSA